MSRLRRWSGLLWHLAVRPALVAVPFAGFFYIQSDRRAGFAGYWVGAMVFSYLIAWSIRANRRWVVPLLARAGSTDRGPGLVWEVASFAFASLFGSLAAAVILQLTISPGILGSGRVAFQVISWSVIFGALFLAVSYARIFKRRYLHRLVAEAETRAREEQELKTAAAIQQALLPPRSYETTTCTAAGASIPCRTIGGDFFDYFEMGEGRLAFTLGDVAGKGPPAAILAAMVQGIFASHVGPDVTPSVTVDRVNQAVLRRAVEGRFATLFYGRLDSKGSLVTCNAGHNPGFLFRADGTMLRLNEGGLMVGAFDFAAYDEEETTLSPGDTLVLYSDGVTDAEAPSGEQFGEERLLACLEGQRLALPDAILERVLEEVRSFASGHPPADDVTVLVVRYGNGLPSASAAKTG